MCYLQLVTPNSFRKTTKYYSPLYSFNRPDNLVEKNARKIHYHDLRLLEPLELTHFLVTFETKIGSTVLYVWLCK